MRDLALKRQLARQYYYEHREEVLAKCKAAHAANPAPGRARVAEWQLNNSEKINTYRREQRKQKPEQFKNYTRKYRGTERGRGVVNAATAARRAKRQQATPQWADLEAIKEIYLNCPKGMHVDHVIPLNGENVCGLHVENNLQYLSAEDNARKSNKF